MNVAKTGFNWWAFFFNSMYYGGKGKLQKGLIMALFAWLPIFTIIIGVYCGKKANEELNEEGFDWKKAVGVFVFQLVVGILMLKVLKK